MGSQPIPEKINIMTVTDNTVRTFFPWNAPTAGGRVQILDVTLSHSPLPEGYISHRARWDKRVWFDGIVVC